MAVSEWRWNYVRSFKSRGGGRVVVGMVGGLNFEIWWEKGKVKRTAKGRRVTSRSGRRVGHKVGARLVAVDPGPGH